MRRYILSPALLSILLSAACSTGEANHLGNPLLWPAMAVTNGIDNAFYDARRQKVEAHVAAHHPALMAEITAGGGVLLTTAMDLAKVAPARRPELVRVLQQDFALYQRDQEALVVALMVHGG